MIKQFLSDFHKKEKLTENVNADEKLIQFHYDDIPVKVVTRRGNPHGYYDKALGGWLPDEDETKDITTDWDYSVPAYDVAEVIVSEFITDEDVPGYNELETDALYEIVELYEIVDAKIDELVEKYYDELLDFYYEQACADAQRNYEYDPYDD